MNKIQKTVHLDPHQVAILSLRGDLNMSGVIRRTLDEYIETLDGVDKQAVEEAVEAIDESSQDIEDAIERYDTLEELLTEAQQQTEA